MSKSNHYIDNKVFFEAMVEWKKLVIEADDCGNVKPPVTEYIGKSSVNHGLLGFAFSMLQMDIAFDYLKVSQVKMFVRKTNSRAILFNKNMGFRKVDVREDFIWFVNTPKDYKEAKARFIKYFTKGTI